MGIDQMQGCLSNTTPTVQVLQQLLFHRRLITALYDRDVLGLHLRFIGFLQYLSEAGGSFSLS